jgi:hypothetical protein
MTIDVNSGARWTDEDQAHYIASMKKDLAALLKDDKTFDALDCPIGEDKETVRAVSRLRALVCALRHELIAWGDA